MGYRLISYPPPKKTSEILSVTPPPEGAVLRPFGPEGCRMKSESKTQNQIQKPNTKPTPKFQNIFSYPNEKIFAKTNTKLSDHFQKIFVFIFGFNFHISFSKPFSQTIFENQYKHFGGWATDYFHTHSEKVPRKVPRIYRKKYPQKITLRSGVFGRKPPCFSLVHIILFSYPNYPEPTGPRPSSRGGASLPPPGGGR